MELRTAEMEVTRLQKPVERIAMVEYDVPDFAFHLDGNVPKSSPSWRNTAASTMPFASCFPIYFTSKMREE